MNCLPLSPAGSDAPEFGALARRSGIAPARCKALGDELPAAVDALWRRHASQVPEGNLDDYVKLGWMAWSSGALELTPAGRAVHEATVERRSTP